MASSIGEGSCDEREGTEANEEQSSLTRENSDEASGGGELQILLSFCSLLDSRRDQLRMTHKWRKMLMRRWLPATSSSLATTGRGEVAAARVCAARVLGDARKQSKLRRRQRGVLLARREVGLGSRVHEMVPRIPFGRRCPGATGRDRAEEDDNSAAMGCWADFAIAQLGSLVAGLGRKKEWAEHEKEKRYDPCCSIQIKTFE